MFAFLRFLSIFVGSIFYYMIAMYNK